MIDWVTCEVPCLHEHLASGRVIKVKPCGTVEWEAVSWVDVEGSHDSTIRVKSSGAALDGRASHLRISGNPAKFLQGHNVFGTDDLVKLMSRFTTALFQKLNIVPSPVDIEQIRIGEYSISRVDINRGFRLKSRSDVLAWLRAAEFKSRTRAGRPAMKGSTLYFSKSSRRWSIKFYAKGQELEAHKLNDNFKKAPLQEYADNLLRAEVTLRSLELRERQIHLAKYFTPHFVEKLFKEYMGRVDMKAQQNLSEEAVYQLPRCLQATYCMWKEGCDLKRVMKETTYYRHRSALLKYDIDINIQPDGVTKFDNVIPLIRVLEAEPASIPEWAYELKLIAC